MLSDLKNENKTVKEMVLFDTDEKLYKAYYATALKRK